MVIEQVESHFNTRNSLCICPSILPKHIQYITYQLLKALKYIHSAKLLHRDIKPSNILIDSSCSIKLCDFGLCRSISSDDLPENLVLTDYIATRWYRSPEILMGSKKYTEGVDLWSAGCILGEMFRTRPLLPGASMRVFVKRSSWLKIFRQTKLSDLFRRLRSSKTLEPKSSFRPQTPSRGSKEQLDETSDKEQ